MSILFLEDQEEIRRNHSIQQKKLRTISKIIFRSIFISIGCKNFLNKLQLSFKKIKLNPGNSPDEKTQKDFIEEFLGLSEKAESGDIHLLCFDPTHQIHNTVL